MTLLEAIEAIYLRWKAAWEVAYPPPAMPFFLANEEGKPPTDGSGYVMLAVHEARSRQSNLAPIGDRRFERRGVVRVRIGQPANSGVKAAAQAVKVARDIFEGVSFSGIHFFAVSSSPSGTDGRWFYQMVDAPFRYYETK